VTADKCYTTLPLPLIGSPFPRVEPVSFFCKLVFLWHHQFRTGCGFRNGDSASTAPADGSFKPPLSRPSLPRYHKKCEKLFFPSWTLDETGHPPRIHRLDGGGRVPFSFFIFPPFLLSLICEIFFTLLRGGFGLSSFLSLSRCGNQLAPFLFSPFPDFFFRLREAAFDLYRWS